MKRIARILKVIYNFFMNIEERLIDEFDKNENRKTILDHDDF